MLPPSNLATQPSCHSTILPPSYVATRHGCHPARSGSQRRRHTGLHGRALYWGGAYYLKILSFFYPEFYCQEGCHPVILPTSNFAYQLSCHPAVYPPSYLATQECGNSAVLTPSNVAIQQSCHLAMLPAYLPPRNPAVPLSCHPKLSSLSTTSW